MKKTMVAAVAAVAAFAAFTSTPALAAGPAAGTLAYDLTGSVNTICGVYNYQGTSIPVSFGELSNTPTSTTISKAAGSASYRCNDANGFSRTIHSANGGKLVRSGSAGDASNSIAYLFNHGGGDGLGTGDISLASDKVSTFGGSTAFLAGQTGGVTFKINGVYNTSSNNNNAPGTTVFAGAYSDTVTITVTGA